ncbi:hypothetical protein KCH_74380 [Kitasatospora cheerisanensis KCTC 2395]|uniref:Uncharacterized protein n=1 Tax=Kitasatospora cheerisanensis KCTC 2395 TaxID=1348663 RepID=A0A066YH39_9ACTN|nr:hypothetical protein KCH_74380 [Kitasatospora cheerisanensis KCTC 2395]
MTADVHRGAAGPPAARLRAWPRPRPRPRVRVRRVRRGGNGLSRGGRPEKVA